MKGLIIFGTGKIAEVVYYYAKNDCNQNVVAFCADKNYTTDSVFHGLPVIDFDMVEKFFPPSLFNMFVAVGYQNINRLRAEKCSEATTRGYKLISIVSPDAHVPENVSVGSNCFIMPGSLIHPFVSFGNNVFVWGGAMVGHHTVVGNNCWLASSSNIGGGCVIGANSFIGMNATITESNTIGASCFLGANVLVAKSIANDKVVITTRDKPIKLNTEQFLQLSHF